MSGAVAGRDVTRAAAWTGTGNVAQFSPQELLQRFGLPPQATSDPQAFTRATVGTRFAVTKDGAELDSLVLTLDETTIRGTFALQGFDAPAYRFRAERRRRRRRPLLAAESSRRAGRRSDGRRHRAAAEQHDEPRRHDAGRLAEARGNAVRGRRRPHRHRRRRPRRSRTRARASTAARSPATSACTPPATTRGSRSTGARASIALEPLIAALTGGEPNFSGTGSFDLNLAGKGRTVTENVQTAGGNVSFEMANGAIKGFNLGRTLCAAYNVTQRAPGPPELAGGDGI